MYRRCLTLILLFAIACIGWGPATIYVKPSTADDYADIMLFWTMENADQSMDADDCYGVDDSTWADADGAPTVEAAAKKIGDLGGLCNSADEYFRLDEETTELFPSAGGRLGFWMYLVNTECGARTTLAMVRKDADEEIFFQIDTDETLRIQFEYNDGDTQETIYTSGATGIAADNWYFIEFRIDCSKSGGSDEMCAYVNGVAKTCVTNVTCQAWGSNPLDYFVGQIGTCGDDIYVDNLMMSNDPDRDLYAISSNTTCPK